MSPYKWAFSLPFFTTFGLVSITLVSPFLYLIIIKPVSLSISTTSPSSLATTEKSSDK